jgi:hypothetical protein
MARDGAVGNEGVALWLGKRDSGKAEVTHVAALRGLGVIKKPALLIIESSLLNDVTDLTIELGVALVGQVHSHGPFFGTDLSPTDRQYGIAVPYYLSVVAPDYALRPHTSIGDCGVHVYESGLGFRRLSVAEVSRQIQVVTHAQIPVITVGEE